CMAAAPNLMRERVVRATLKALNAEAGVDVDQQRQVADIADAPDIGENIVQVGDAKVRHAERAGGDAAAREIDRAIAHALRHQRVVGADTADDLERTLLPEGFAELRTGAHTAKMVTVTIFICRRDGARRRAL